MRLIKATATLLLLLAWQPARAGAADTGLDLPATCASVHVTGLHRPAPPANGFDTGHFDVRLAQPAHGMAPSMTADALHVTSTAAATSTAALERAASASAASLLLGLAGSTPGDAHPDCPAGLLQQAGRPIADGLQKGGAYGAQWRRVTLRGASGHVEIRRMELRLEGADSTQADRPVHVALILDGVSGKLAQPSLLPGQVTLRVTLPASSLPALLTAAGGAASSATRIPLTVDTAQVSEGATVLDGRGVATAVSPPLDSTAALHITARHFDDLVNRAAVLGLVRLHTALFVSSLMGRGSAGELQWDVSFKDGLLSVNNVPIPMR